MDRKPNTSYTLPEQPLDVLVIGSGFGGLGAALRLAEEGAQVGLCEILNYPGGCASTFKRHGYRFEAGATLFSGFDPGQIFHHWIKTHNLDVTIDWIDPLVELRTPSWSMEICRDREAFQNAFFSMPNAPVEGLRAFFETQEKTASSLWELFNAPDLLPPFGDGALWTHIRRSPKYLPLLRLVGRPIIDILKRYDIHTFEPLVTYLNALCQITVQCSAHEAEAPFAMSTADYYFRGTGHVRGGIGNLAWALTDAIEACGGHVFMANRAKSLSYTDGLWTIETRRGTIRARNVVANLLPKALLSLLPENTPAHPRLQHLDSLVQEGWGAVMHYLVIDPKDTSLTPQAHHLELVADPSKPFVEGNHLFCSISGHDDPDRAPDNQRTVTVSTHIALAPFLKLSNDEQATRTAAIQATMLENLQKLAPDWFDNIVHQMPGSPRTFERFTRRPHGYVGGIPRRAGLHHYQYKHLFPRPTLPGLYMVGDTVFPGQSTLATAIGGCKIADSILKTRLNIKPSPLTITA